MPDKWTDRIVRRLDNAREWPLREELELLGELALWIAFRESNGDALRKEAQWTDSERRYFVDPLPLNISRTLASLMHGGKPRFIAPAEADQARYDDIVRTSRLRSAFQREAETTTSEGEVWWRLSADKTVADVPIFSWYSRTAVLPYWWGPILKACAFVDRLPPADDRNEEVVHRHFELHEDGLVRNVLYAGGRRRLGKRVPLSDHYETADLPPEWEHDLPGMLAGRIINREGIGNVGASDYEPIRDYLLMLNEAVTVGHENMRLTAKKRVVVESTALDAQGNLRGDQEVLVADREDQGLGESSGTGPWRVLEYSFDADALIAYMKNVIEAACTRVGIQPQFAGVGAIAEGFAESGTALKVRLLPSVNAGENRAQHWDDEVPAMTHMAARLDSLPVAQGGFGRGYTNVDAPPVFEREPSLPENPTEEVERNSRAYETGIQSLETSIRDLHPDWSDRQVTDEMGRIEDDKKKFGAANGSLFDVLKGDGGNPTNNGDDPSRRRLEGAAT